MNLGERTQKIQQWLTSRDTTTPPTAQEYQELVDLIIEHNQLYYQKNRPIISDEEYDKLFEALKQIEENNPFLISPDSPTQRLVGQLSEQFDKVHHKVKLTSLENSYNAQDLEKFDEKIHKVVEKYHFTPYHYFIEPKYDGLSVELIYENGRLIQGSTRGDGDTGEDITANVKTIKNIPYIIENAPALLSVRGEIMMSKKIFKQLNQEKIAKGEEPFANTRNAAAGSIKILDTAEVAKRHLSCFIYEVLYAQDQNGNPINFNLSNTFEQINLQEQPGTIEDMIRICKDPKTKAFLEAQDFDFDGLVIKIEEQKNEKAESLREKIGTTNHHPKRGIAYKFPAKQVETQILSLDLQVGRTGVITPVANLQPVTISGAEISRVSLHNFDFIAKKEIRKGDHIRIQRSGEVIPYVTGVIKERRTGEEELIEPPLFCPVCNAPIYKIENLYYCSNLTCKAQLKERILHFVSKECMNILGIWENIIDLLIQQGIINNIIDIYHLTDIHTQILLKKLPGLWDKKLTEIAKEIENSKQAPLRRIIHALGIPNIGIKTAKDIEQFLYEKECKNLRDCTKMLSNPNEISQLYGIGEKTTLALQYYLNNAENQSLLEELQRQGIWFTAIHQKEEKAESFSITGTFPIPRGKIIQEVSKSLTFHDHPKKGTTYILVGENAGNKKEKAKENGSIIIEGRAQVIEKFPTLKGFFPTSSTKTEDQQNTLQQSLF